MEKRFQVFISSTYRDLKEERQEVLRTIIELEQFPAGMELFPASDTSIWEHIKKVIDESDFYVVIVGDRYGSIDDDGTSYTENEFNYATEIGKPILIFIKDIDRTNHSEKLKKFIEKLKKPDRSCVFWENKEYLALKIYQGVDKLVKAGKGTGWVKADQVLAENQLRELIELKKENEKLNKELEFKKNKPPDNIEGLKKGDDIIPFNYTATFVISQRHSRRSKRKLSTNTTINQIWAAVSPSLLKATSDKHIKLSVSEYLKTVAKKHFMDNKDVNLALRDSYDIDKYFIDTIVLQFRSLGLMRSRLVNNIIYWSITSYGDSIMTGLKTLKKT